MKPKTENGTTRPAPSSADCNLLDRAIDLMLLYKQYESEPSSQAVAAATVNGLRTIAKRCKALLEGPVPPDAEDE